MPNNVFIESLKDCAVKANIEISDDKADKLYGLYLLMLSENERQNLTRITEPSEAAEKHMIDSLTVNKYMFSKAKVADIGCGAGFPSLPLAIMNSETAFIPVDSTEKRIRYVNSTAQSLGLSNVSATAARAEELGKNPIYREKFDIVTARAVASLNILCEYCLPLVKVGGKFIAMKASVDTELNDAMKAISILGGKLIEKECIKLPISKAERNIIVIEKIKATPQNYPRAGGAISKKPL